MSKPIQRPGIYYMKEVYADYAMRTLQANPTWWGKYGKTHKMKNCFIYAQDKHGKPVLKLSWPMWKECMESFFHRAKDAVIHGESLKLGAGVGKIRAVRIQRSFHKPQVDWGSTFQMNLRDEQGRLKKVYHTSEDYCRIEWVKYGILTHDSKYRFSPATRNMATGKGFKAEFSQALHDDPLLKYRYKYYPLNTKNKYKLRQLAKTAAEEALQSQAR